MRFRFLSCLWIGMCLLWVASVANASIPLGTDRVRLSGFATLGLTRGGTDTLGFRGDLDRSGVYNNDWTLKVDSLLGLQLDADITDALSATVQAVYKDRSNAKLSDYFDWAYLRYRIGPSWTLRVGRLGASVFLLSDYRQLGFSYIWARPPVEFYTPIVFTHFDGADLAYSTPLGPGTFTAKVFAGDTKMSYSTFGHDLDLRFTPFGGTFSWETENWQTRFSVVTVRAGTGTTYLKGTDLLVDNLIKVSDVWPDALTYANAFKLNNKKINYYSVGVSYDNQPWVVQSEINYIDSSAPIFRSFSSSYVSLGYRVGSTTIYGVLAKVRNTQSRTKVSIPPSGTGNDVLLSLLQQGLQTFFDSSSFNQHTASLGMRWNIRYDLALKLQWDHTWVDAYGSGLWDQRSILNHDETMNTFSLNLNGVF